MLTQPGPLSATPVSSVHYLDPPGSTDPSLLTQPGPLSATPVSSVHYLDPPGSTDPSLLTQPGPLSATPVSSVHYLDPPGSTDPSLLTQPGPLSATPVSSVHYLDPPGSTDPSLLTQPGPLSATPVSSVHYSDPPGSTAPSMLTQPGPLSATPVSSVHYLDPPGSTDPSLLTQLGPLSATPVSSVHYLDPPGSTAPSLLTQPGPLSATPVSSVHYLDPPGSTDPSLLTQPGPLSATPVSSVHYSDPPGSTDPSLLTQPGPLSATPVSSVHYSDSPGSTALSVMDLGKKDFVRPSPLICAKGEGKATWSRSYRTQMKLRKVSLDPARSKITDYYQILNKIEKLVRENDQLSFLLQQSPGHDTQTVSCLEKLTPVLQSIITNAESNVDRSGTGRRHPTMVKKFATAVFIYAGPLAYELLQQNMPEALPSLRTVQRNVHKEFKPTEEGHFRFDELVNHIRHYNAPRIVAIGEDATRVVVRIDYDSETDRCVGFVLPVDSNGLPIVDSFQATSFTAMQTMFSKETVAKYAYVYMAQPLGHNIPPFCLACIGTDNKYKAEEVLLRWKHIQAECHRRGIWVVSYGGDGDSRVMKAMKVAMQETEETCILRQMIPESTLPQPKIPQGWNAWYTMDSSAIAYVQDAVHIAVKLKSRLLKPSVVLSMGLYTATGQHFQMIKKAFTKEEHGLREKDVDHKDKQNSLAVLKLLQASHLLNRLPDAAGTAVYVDIIASVIDCYINKDLDILTRIERVWYAVFFLRYWRQWVLLDSNSTLRDNFVTNNAYQCIEFNANAIVALTLTIRDHLQETTLQPWLLGSQTCERIFRAARSMSSVFSTIINFSMLGLLRRLHRLQIQLTIQSETSSNIIFPRLEKKCARGGISTSSNTGPLLTNEEINDAVERARDEAKRKVQVMGMDEELKKHLVWESSAPYKAKLEVDEDGEEDEVEEGAVKSTLPIIVGEVCQDNPNQMEEDIKSMKKNGLIDAEVEAKLMKLNEAVALQPRQPVDTSMSKQGTLSSKFSPFVEIFNEQGTSFLLRKSTAVWLLQESERVSTDRLFRVRAKQPYANK